MCNVHDNVVCHLLIGDWNYKQNCWNYKQNSNILANIKDNELNNKFDLSYIWCNFKQYYITWYFLFGYFVYSP